MGDTGFIFFDNCNNVCFKANDVNVSVRALDMLTDIYAVNEFNKDGYIVVETNYGEEFYHLGELLRFLGVYNDKWYKYNLSKIKRWVIKNGKRPKLFDEKC